MVCKIMRRDWPATRCFRSEIASRWVFFNRKFMSGRNQRASSRLLQLLQLLEAIPDASKLDLPVARRLRLVVSLVLSKVTCAVSTCRGSIRGSHAATAKSLNQESSPRQANNEGNFATTRSRCSRVAPRLALAPRMLTCNASSKASLARCNAGASPKTMPVYSCHEREGP